MFDVDQPFHGLALCGVLRRLAQHDVEHTAVQGGIRCTDHLPSEVDVVGLHSDASHLTVQSERLHEGVHADVAARQFHGLHPDVQRQQARQVEVHDGPFHIDGIGGRLGDVQLPEAQVE